MLWPQNWSETELTHLQSIQKNVNDLQEKQNEDSLNSFWSAGYNIPTSKQTRVLAGDDQRAKITAGQETGVCLITLALLGLAELWKLLSQVPPWGENSMCVSRSSAG